jgi:hypothetical protein
MNEASGRIWEIAAAVPMAAAQADRELNRKLKEHPAAKEIPAEPDATQPSP